MAGFLVTPNVLHCLHFTLDTAFSHHLFHQDGKSDYCCLPCFVVACIGSNILAVFSVIYAQYVLFLCSLLLSRNHSRLYSLHILVSMKYEKIYDNDRKGQSNINIKYKHSLDLILKIIFACSKWLLLKTRHQ